MIVPVIALESVNPVNAAVRIEADRLGLTHRYEETWPTSVTSLDDVLPSGVNILCRHHMARNGHGNGVLLRLQDSLAVLWLNGSHFSCSIVTRDGRYAEALAWVKALFPEPLPVEGKRTVVFWNLSKDGADSNTRLLMVPKWADVRSNYSGNVREALDHLMQKSYRPAEAGRLILWRGVPGTGKTYAIRALIEEWAEWAEFNYIVDPDAFFGAVPDYMMSVILNEDGDDRKWRVLILEDSGELLAADAKANTGQGLSRLLNLVDGLVGQGLRLLVLVTTNEELGKLNPAVSRAGRCLLNLEFPPMSNAEVAEWAKAHALETPPASGKLSDLFAALTGGTVVPAPEAVGFTP